MMEAVRSLGLAARFVTGYVYVPDRDGSADTRGGGSTHAWCQVYLPGAGWVEFDPTNGIVGNRDLIRVAVARDPARPSRSPALPQREADYTGMTIAGERDHRDRRRAGAPPAAGGGGGNRRKPLAFSGCSCFQGQELRGAPIGCGSALDIDSPMNARSPRRCCWC